MPFETLQARSKYDTPSHKDGGEGLPADVDYTVYLRHPGYSDIGNILLALPALDHAQGGIHHETARIACAILANNRWDGFLAETKAGQPITAGPDDILREKNYYYFVSRDSTDKRYAVIPIFSHWRFPHDNMPQSWMSCAPPKLPQDRPLPRKGSLTEATLGRDISCRITNHIEGTEHAHLVPRNEERWFSENGMFRYTKPQRPGSEPVDDAQNAILLRSDVHTIFDQKRFGVVPKSSLLVVHIMAPGSSLELTRLYHNVPLQPLVGVAIQYLLARFAWTVFAYTSGFIQQGMERLLCIHVGDEENIKNFSGEQCRQLFLQGPKSRSQSPRKRQRDTFAAPPEEGDDEEQFRGRKRRRSFSPRSPGQSFDEKLWTTSQETLSDLNTDSESESSETNECTGEKLQLRLLVDPYRKCDAGSEPTTGV